MRNNELSRREFLAAFVTAVSACALGPALAATTLNHKSDDASKTTSTSSTGKMPQRLLGRTGVKVGILGMGGAEYFARSQDDDAVIQLLSKAIASGINYFDTCPTYGRSEQNFSLVLPKHRSKIFLATKCDHRDYDGAMKEIEKSLKTLKTDTIDLMQVHGVSDREDLEVLWKKDGVIAALEKLRAEKVIRFIGATGHPEDHNVAKALEHYDWDVFLGFINPRFATRPMYDEQLPVCLRKQMGVAAMKIFGGSTPGQMVGEQPGTAPAKQLLRYALSQNITVVIPPVASLAQLEENLSIARNFTPMTPEEREAIIARVNQTPLKAERPIASIYPYVRVNT